MAERNYSPFSGYSGSNGGSREKIGAMGSKLAPVNWSTKTLTPGKWKVVDANAIRKAAGAKDEPHSTSHATAHTSKSAALSPAEVEEWRQSHTITISDANDCPTPITQFDMLTSVPSYLKAKLLDQGFQAPTPIQAQSWPIVLSGRDLVGVAKTGSGKTLAFVVPALAHIAMQEPMKMGDGPMVIVLAPTRELAQQIEQETVKVLPQSIRCGCVYGGAPKGPQLGLLRQGVHILVATPGRLIDFIEIRRVNLLRVTYLVLDEADRMLDMGFEPQVRAICGQIRPDRQTLMFSATWPREIQNLAATFQRDWIRINVGSLELLANKDVTQNFILTTEAGKQDALHKLMEKHRNQRVLVFCKTKKTADYLEYQLKRSGVDAMAIHGDKEQRQREFILERFRKDPRLCVVATDVAARGLDIKELGFVINYDFPMQIDDYVHRIGRTGRAGAKGEAYTMITKHETQLNAPTVRQLLGLVERAGQEVPEWMREWANQGGGYATMKRNRNMMGSFDRGGPRMRMPGDSTNNHFGGGAAAGGASAGGSHFGLKPHGNGAQAFGAPSSSGIQNKRFDYSSDDDERPAKRARD